MQLNSTIINGNLNDAIGNFQNQIRFIFFDAFRQTKMLKNFFYKYQFLKQITEFNSVIFV